VRVWLRSVGVLVAAIVAGLILWRVLAPAEVLSPSASPSSGIPVLSPGVTGRAGVAPLIVDGRLRVYAAKRQVRADMPVSASSVLTPNWSYRRWPEQLSGVVAIGRTVVSRWSDGDLVAIDGMTGKIVWRASGPPAPGFGGHRTGSATVWAPPGLHVAAGSVVVIAGQQLIAYAGSTGKRLRTTSLPPGCTDGFTTTGGLFVCSSGAYDPATGLAVGSFPTGPFTPVGCDVAASMCPALRDGAGHGWMLDRPVPRRLTQLDRAGSTVAAGLVIYPYDGTLRAVAPAGTDLWTYPSSAQVLGATATSIVLLTPERHLVVVDARIGAPRANFMLLYPGETDLPWSPGRWQVGDGYVAIERLEKNHPSDPDTEQPVIIAAV
jgi:outer membrane protein assembly factor BamB